MNQNKTKKLAMAGVLCAVAVAGSYISIPVFGSKCAPVQHMVNILSAILLGPWYGVGIAFSASLIRNLLSLGTPLAFTSMIGALLSGFAYYKTKNTWLVYLAEIIGSGVLGGLCAYPIAIFIMGKDASNIAFYTYVIPFLISVVGGAVLSVILVEALIKANVLKLQKES